MVVFCKGYWNTEDKKVHHCWIEALWKKRFRIYIPLWSSILASLYPHSHESYAKTTNGLCHRWVICNGLISVTWKVRERIHLETGLSLCVVEKLWKCSWSWCMKEETLVFDCLVWEAVVKPDGGQCVCLKGWRIEMKRSLADSVPSQWWSPLCGYGKVLHVKCVALPQVARLFCWVQKTIIGSCCNGRMKVSEYLKKKISEQWITRLVDRWRTQPTARSMANCRASWNHHMLNTYCDSGLRARVSPIWGSWILEAYFFIEAKARMVLWFRPWYSIVSFSWEKIRL